MLNDLERMTDQELDKAMSALVRIAEKAKTPIQINGQIIEGVVFTAADWQKAMNEADNA